MTARLWSTLRLAARLVRRSAARSVLIAALIAIAAFAGSFAAVTIRTAQLSSTEAAARSLGHADAIAQVSSFARVDPAQSAIGRDAKGQSQFVTGGERGHQPRGMAWSQLLPRGSRLTPDAWNYAATVTANGRSEDLSEVVLDLADPMTSGLYDLRRGRLPQTTDEVAVTQALAGRFGLRPGSTLTLRRSGPPLTRTVSAVVRDPFGYDSFAVVGAADALGGLGDLNRDGNVGSWLVDLPGASPPDLHARLAAVGVIYETRANWEHPVAPLSTSHSVNANYLIILATIAGFGLLEILLLAGAAFAVGARRQTRELGLLAAVGADTAAVRNTVLGQGAVLGLAGSVAGAALGVLAVPLSRTWMQNVANHSFGGLDVRAGDLVSVILLGLVAGLLAAVVPARYAARRPVIDSLRDRFRAGDATARNPKWATTAVIAGPALIALSAYMWHHNPAGGFNSVNVQVGSFGEFVSGLFRLLRQNAWPTGIWIGTAVALAGVVRSCGSLLGRLARVAGRLSLGPRLALRDAARHRHRTAPATAAVLTVLAGIVIVLFVVSGAHLRREQQYQPQAPVGSVAVTTNLGDAGGAALTTATERVRAALGGRVTVLRSTIGAGTRSRLVSVALPGCGTNVDQCGEGPVGVIDPGQLAALAADIPASEARELTDGGALLIDPNLTSPRDVAILDTAQHGRVVARLHAVRSVIPPYASLPVVLVSPATAAAHGWPATPTSAIVTPPNPPTQTAVDGLQARLGPQTNLALGRPFHDDGYSVVLLALLGAAVIATLAGTSVSVALALAESRADLATLAAVGASPGRRRLHAMGQAATVSSVGVVLGALLGAFVATATLEGSNFYTVSVPYRWIAVLLVGVPLVAVSVAGLMTRSRVVLTRRIA